MYIFQIIKQVLEAHRGLPNRLSEKTGHSPEWYRSHGYPPKTLDAFGNGNKCAEVENYIEFVELYERSAKGAGQMLNRMIAAELHCRLTDGDDACTERELRRVGLKEATEALQALDKKDFHEASQNDLTAINVELDGVQEWLDRARKRVHTEFEKRNIAKDYGFTN